MGKWFGRHVEAGATIATPDIGAIGYFSRARIFDLAGLVTPKMVPLIEREPWEDALANLRFAGFARPSYVVDRAPLADDLLRRSPYAPAFTLLGREGSEPRHRDSGRGRLHLLSRRLADVRAHPPPSLTPARACSDARLTISVRLDVFPLQLRAWPLG